VAWTVNPVRSSCRRVAHEFKCTVIADLGDLYLSYTPCHVTENPVPRRENICVSENRGVCNNLGGPIVQDKVLDPLPDQSCQRATILRVMSFIPPPSVEKVIEDPYKVTGGGAMDRDGLMRRGSRDQRHLQCCRCVLVRVSLIVCVPLGRAATPGYRECIACCWDFSLFYSAPDMPSSLAKAPGLQVIRCDEAPSHANLTCASRSGMNSHLISRTLNSLSGGFDDSEDFDKEGP